MFEIISRMTEEVRSTLHEDPSKVSHYLYKNPRVVVAWKKGLFSSLFRRTEKEIVFPPLKVKPLPYIENCDLEKTWHGLHFLFTGSYWDRDFPAGFLVTCGTMVGDFDGGHEPRSFNG